MAYRRILSLDGGGVRGLIPARVLAEIEARAGRAIHLLFDLIVGTSTGGILACGLAAPPAQRRPRPFPASEMAALYRDRGREIFARSFWDGVASLGGAAEERYDAAPLEGILAEMLGEAELKDTAVDIVVTAYDIEARRPYLFKTSRAREGAAGRNHLLRDAARATSAAPTYFEPLLLDRARWAGEESRRRALVDGGVFANNPSTIALSEALASGARLDEILVCAIGTGTTDRPIPYEDARDWGAVRWVRPAIAVMMDGMSDAADYHMRALLPGAEPEPAAQRYFRFDVPLTRALDDLDAAHRANIAALDAEADRIVAEQGEEIDRLVALLLAAAPESLA